MNRVVAGRGALGLAATLVGLMLVLGGCGSSTGPVAVTPPAPTGQAAQVCQRLHAALPHTLDGHPQRPTSPDSPFTAAYGDPAITVRCGGSLPPILTPGSPSFDPTTQQDVVNDVGWVIESLPHEHRFTTYQRVANVEVTVPDHYDPNAVNPLVDLAAPVSSTVPVGG